MTRFGLFMSLRRKGHVALLIAIAMTLLAGCKTELYSKVSEQEANEMVAALSETGIRADKTSPDGKTWSVTVAESEIPAAIERLREQGLPRDRFHSLGDVFKKEGLVSSPSEERIRFIYAMSQELSNTLSQIDGVITARVHVVIPANDPLVEKMVPASASVFIKHRPELDTQAVTPAIKNLVYRSIEGLNYENISVSFFLSDRPSTTVAALTGFTWVEYVFFVLLGALAVLAAVGMHPVGRAAVQKLVSRVRALVSSLRPRPRAEER